MITGVRFVMVARHGLPDRGPIAGRSRADRGPIAGRSRADRGQRQEEYGTSITLARLKRIWPTGVAVSCA
jgi:hypothetical protein